MASLRPISPVSGASGPPQCKPSLTPQRWQTIKQIFSAALEREPRQRARYLDDACKEDDSLRAEVESLLLSAESEGVATNEVFKAVLTKPQVPMFSETEDPMLGRRVGDYRIERRIGYGGMAAVYLASRADEQFQMRAAVKLLRPDLDYAELLRRFLNERQTLAALDHPHIVKLLDGGSTEESLPYLVMDYVEGVPIDEYCDEHTLSVQQRLRLFCTVCEAVAYAHQHNVIHRDLKPNNILVTRDGKAKLLDFGIAKVLDTSNTLQLATRTANRHLTPAFASPEQVRGDTVAATTDIYSLGVLLYALLTGRRPYRIRERTPAALERAICEQEPESPSTAVDRVETETRSDGTTVTITAESVSRTREGQPEKLRRSLRGDLDTIIMKALQKEPQHRYHSVAELAADIQRHLEHRPILARPATLAYRLSKLLWRHKTEMIAMAAVALILVSAIGFSVWEERSATARARAELTSQRSRGRRSVAVLGFKNLSARSETAWLSTALSEMLTTELSLGGKLRTIPGENVAQTKANLSLQENESLSPQTLTRLYKNLGSDFVVLGSYLDLGSSDKSIRLDVKVQDAALGETVASIIETGDESSLPDLVNRAGSVLRGKLQVSQVSEAEAASAQVVLPSNPDAVRFYAEGLDRLRRFDALGAREKLEQAIASDPLFVMAHSALAESWASLGYDAKARAEARKAFDLSGGLPREESLLIEARYRRATKELSKATTIYQTLFNFFPDNMDYGLQLAACQTSEGKGTEAFTTLDAMRHLPPPSSSDPRIDLAEAAASAAIEDYQRLARAAESAAIKGSALGSQLVVAQAHLDQASAWRALGDPKRAKVMMEEARRLFLASGDRLGEAKALRGIGAIFVDQGNFPSAKSNLEEALRVVRQIGNRAAETDLLGLLAQMYYRQGDMNDAKETAEQYLASAREIGDMSNQSDALNKIGKIESTQNQFTPAAAHFQEALRMARAIGNQSQVVRILNNLGSMYMKKDEDRLAKRTLQEALAITRQTGNKDDTGVSLLNLADATGNLGDLGGAVQLYNQALQIFRDTGNRAAESYAILNRADIKMLQDDLAGAEAGYKEAIQIAEKIGAKAEAAKARVSLANVETMQGRHAEAEHLAREAAQQFHEEKDPIHEAHADSILAYALRGQGRLNEALAIVASAESLVADINPLSRADLIILEAQLRASGGDSARATALLTEVVEQARKAGWLNVELQARLDRGDITAKSGKVDQARTELRLVERDAKAKGFLIIARSAAEIRKRLTHH
jgi:eukaryotic-like serine/threonine-protein kinase